MQLSFITGSRSARPAARRASTDEFASYLSLTGPTVAREREVGMLLEGRHAVIYGAGGLGRSLGRGGTAGGPDLLSHTDVAALMASDRPPRRKGVNRQLIGCATLSNQLSCNLEVA